MAVKLGVGGFSMGAATALYSAISYVQGKYENGNPYPANLSAVVGLSGWLPCSKSGFFCLSFVSYLVTWSNLMVTIGHHFVIGYFLRGWMGPMKLQGVQSPCPCCSVMEKVFRGKKWRRMIVFHENVQVKFPCDICFMWRKIFCNMYNEPDLLFGSWWCGASQIWWEVLKFFELSWIPWCDIQILWPVCKCNILHWESLYTSN